jgi:hypothetical protein
MLINDIYVFENVIDSVDEDIMFEYMKTKYTQWYFVEDVAKVGIHNLQFNGWSRHVTNEEPIEDIIFNIIKKIERNALNKSNLKFIKNYRYKLNCLEPLNTIATLEQLYSNTHIDDTIQHIVLMYYANDVDGDTILFDKNNQILKSISPKKGKVVLFDGSISHCPSWPTKENRYVLNYNIVVQSKEKKVI